MEDGVEVGAEGISLLLGSKKKKRRRETAWMGLELD